MTTITQTITTLPTAPDPATQTPAQFSSTAAAYVLAQKDMVPQLNTWAGQVNTVAGEVSDNAASAATDAATASAAATYATSTANATLWVSGTTYGLAVSVISPVDFQTYRRKIAGAGTTDPSADNTNWEPLGGQLSGLTDVNFTALADTQIARYDSASGKWVNADLPADPLVLIATYTLSATSTIDIEDFSATYDDYIIEVADVVNTSRIFSLNMRLKIGGIYQTASTYNYAGLAYDTSSSGVERPGGATAPTSINCFFGDNGGTLIYEPLNASTYGTWQTRLRFFGVNDTSMRPFAEIDCSGPALGRSHPSRGRGIGSWTGAAGALSGVRLYTGGGSLTTGTIRVYGVTKA